MICKSVLSIAIALMTLMATHVNGDDVVNLLTDCSHEYSFNLSNADRNQSEIFPGFNCLTSGRTIHKLDLEPVNALVVLVDGKLPYLPADAPHLLNYVQSGGGLYVSVKTGGAYADSVLDFLAGLGLEDAGPRLASDPAHFGISAHAPSEIVLTLDGSHTRFTSRVGLWADYGRGSVSFDVYGDGKPLHTGKVLHKGARESIDIDITGVKTLRLVATDGGDNNHADNSVWFDPRLVTAAGKSERVLLHGATSASVGWGEATQDMHFNGMPLGIARAADAQAMMGNSIVATDHPAALKNATWRPARPWPGVRARSPEAWTSVYTAGSAEPVVFTRAHGKGTLVVDLSGLYPAAIEQKKPALAVMRALIRYMSRGKQVASIKGGGGWQFSEGYRWDRVETTDDGLRIHHNEYTRMYVPQDIRAYKKTVDYLTQLTGLDEGQKAAQIKALEDRKATQYAGTRVEVDLSGVRELTLIATDGGDGISSDHAIWADAFFEDAQGQRTPLRLADASHVKPGYGRATQNCLPDGSGFSIGGKKFSEGVSLHANGTMTIPLHAKYRKFSAWVGCNDSGYGSVGFKVIGDDTTLWDDGRVYLAGHPGGNPDDVNYVPEGVLFQIKYLACVGAGFLLPQGAAVDLPPALKDDWQVHLGMFSHEMGHAWAYPFCEKIGEEASAFIFNNLILHQHNNQRHGESVTARLMGYLKHGDLDTVDLARSANDFKYYMFIDLMIREYGEGVWKNYNLLKYALLNKEGAVWNAHSTAWLWSIAIGRDAFPYFQQAFGSSVDPEKAQLPAKARALGYSPVAIGKMYDVPLVRLPRQRDIFSTLKSFKDVRNFYKKESAEKGQPAVEG